MGVATDVPVADAQDVGNTIGLVVGVSLVTSVITTATTLGVLLCIRRYMTRKNRLKRDPVVRASMLSSEPGSMRSDESAQPLTGRYVRQQSAVSQASSVNGDLRKSRVKSDFIAKWCTSNTLTEKTAEVLREHGFTYREAVEAMDVNDVASLGLQRAQECVLRRVLNLRQRNSSASSQASRQQQQQQQQQAVHRAVSEEAIPLNSHNTSGGSSGVFERTQSMDQVDGTIGGPTPLKGSILKRKSMGSSMEILEDRGCNGESTIIIRTSNKVIQQDSNSIVNIPPHLLSTANKHRKFNGLLSDKGLWKLAQMIGVEWTRLATYLNVPHSVQEQLKLDNPNHTLKQIYSVLMIWRDTCPGSKQHVKGVLYKALCECDRSDLGEDILREETHGSEERVAYHSII